ncbi:MAG: TIGR01212 family radical SAM protein [Bdellovibrionales bacterium]|nr:TIGR01212 family radical SAM protein [Bdellovibrionales bacterium]
MQEASFKPPERPYFAISDFYKQKFGEKVFKVPVALAGDCPNRMGLKGMKTCIFCDEHGSFAYPQNQEKALREQIGLHMERVSERFNSKKFLVYFQAYTTTFTAVKKLKEAFDVALEFDGVVGVVIGTRPDCLSPALFDVFNEYLQKTFVAIELGVQSFDNKQLDWMRRGHSSEDAKKSVAKLKENCPDLNIGIHLMFGWPGETLDDVARSAEICNELGVDNVKLHNLHVLKNTPLQEMFDRKEFKPVDKSEYFEMVGVFLDHLSPRIAVHRLVAIASRWDELVAPQWTRHKMTNYQHAIDHLNQNQHYQGKVFDETL